MKTQMLFQRCLSFFTLLLLFGISFYQEIFTKRKYRLKTKCLKDVEVTMNEKNAVEQRKHPRQITETPIMLADWNLKNCSDGTLRNLSAGGINLKIENALSPGGSIFFQITEEIEMAITDLKKDEIVPAEVIWCVESKEQFTNSYCVGMKFISELD